MQDYYVTTLSSLQKTSCTSPVNMSKRTATPSPLVGLDIILAMCDMCRSLPQG